MTQFMNDNEKIKNEQNLNNCQCYTQDIQNHKLILSYSAAYKLPGLLVPTDYIIQVGFSQI